MPPCSLLHLFDLHAYETGEASADGRHTLAGVDAQIGDYAARALLLPGRGAVVPQDAMIDPYVAELRGWGIGPTEVLQVDGGNGLYDGILASTTARDFVRGHVEGGGKIQVFVPTESCWQFCERMGIPTSVLHNQPSELVRVTDKAGFRKLAADLGVRGAFPEHRFARTAHAARVDAMELFRLRHKTVFVKRPDLASGTGMIKLTRDDLDGAPFAAFLDRYAGSVELIVEAGWGDEDFSFVFEVSDTMAPLQYITGQFMEADRITHAGNFVGAGYHDCLPKSWGGEIRTRFVDEVLTYMDPILDNLRTRGYRGKLCVDVRGDHLGHAKLLELNARPSASNFPHAVLEQVRQRHGRTAGAAVMLNIWLPEPLESYEVLRARIGADMYDPCTGRGIVPGNVLCVRHQRPKFGAVMVGETVSAAVEAILAFKRRTEGCAPDLTVPAHMADLLAAK